MGLLPVLQLEPLRVIQEKERPLVQFWVDSGEEEPKWWAMKGNNSKATKRRQLRKKASWTIIKKHLRPVWKVRDIL